MKKLTFLILSLLSLQSAFAYEMKGDTTLKPYCGDAVTIEAKATTGYHFISWSDGLTDAIRTFQPNQDSIIYANFGIDSCIVVFYNSDGTVLQTDTLEYGDNLYDIRPTSPTIPESQKQVGHEYTFNGWNPEITPDHTVPASTDSLKYTATYTDTYLLYTVNVDIDPAFGDVSITASAYEGGKYHYGDEVEITVTNIDGCYKFVNWTRDDTGAEFSNQITYKFTITENLNLTAHLERVQFNIQIQSNNEVFGTVGGMVIVPKGVGFEAAEDSATVSMSGAPNLMYSINNGASYQDWDGSKIILPNKGDKVYFKANSTGNNTIENTFSTTKKLNVSGNIMYLLNGETPTATMTADNANCFKYLFMSSSIVDASRLELPATTLAENCYNGMFFGCSNLKKAPRLPAKTMASCCYMAMFYGCSSLMTAPQLQATTLASNCYNGMFNGCTSLTTAPALPAQTLEDGCYGGMFQGCTGLTTAPKLPATTVVKNCYHSMFRGCTSLTTAPELKATMVEDDCYGSMFYGCSNLTTAPVLKAPVLKNGCYYGMFTNCDKLTELTVLATSIESGVYDYYIFGIDWLPYSSDHSKILRVDPTMVNWWKNSYNKGWTVVAYEE